MAKDAASGTITAGMTYMTTSKVGLRKIARKVAKRTATGLAKNAVLGPKPPAGRVSMAILCPHKVLKMTD